jgi:hypothetical protein
MADEAIRPFARFTVPSHAGGLDRHGPPLQASR